MMYIVHGDGYKDTKFIYLNKHDSDLNKQSTAYWYGEFRKRQRAIKKTENKSEIVVELLEANDCDMAYRTRAVNIDLITFYSRSFGVFFDSSIHNRQ